MDDLPKKIVFSVQVEHVFFFIAESPEWEGWFTLFSESRKEGRRNLGECYSLDEAYQHLEEEMDTLSAILDRKREKQPTPNQLMFLFREKIPIPLDLTWGEASDLISDRLAQIQEEKQKKRVMRLQIAKDE